MAKDREVKLRLGYGEHVKKVTLDLPDDEPTPWDLDAKLDVMG